MEIIIKQHWNDQQRKEQIENYIELLGIDLFKKCKRNKRIQTETLENISINLCVAYIKSKINPYINNISYGSIMVQIDDYSVYELVEFATAESSISI